MSGDAWIGRAIEVLEGADGAPRDEALVRVLVAGVRGSTPREAGAWMLVGPDCLHGTIGGGRLEWEALVAARALLARADTPQVQVREWVLGPELGQCCGGRVSLWIERLNSTSLPALRATLLALRNAGGVRLSSSVDAGGELRREVVPLRASLSGRAFALDAAQRVLVETLVAEERPLLLFGAGHVGQAIVRVLDEVPGFELRWYDTRDQVAGLPAPPVRHSVTADPVSIAAAAPPGSLVLVMTHDHALDYELCSATLARGEAAWVGLIASRSKAARFRSRLARAGLGTAAARLLCAPIGLPGIAGKSPGIIAVGVVAQLLQLTQAQARLADPAPADSADSAGCAGGDCRGCAAPDTTGGVLREARR
jgi:xanthine dehydrogenase accessory factor